MCQWVEVQGTDVRDTERVAKAAKSGHLPEAPERLAKKGLPPKSSGMARAGLKEDRNFELKWSGGNAGSK